MNEDRLAPRQLFSAHSRVSREQPLAIGSKAARLNDRPILMLVLGGDLRYYLLLPWFAAEATGGKQ